MFLGSFIPLIAHAEGIDISVKDLMYRISYHIVNPIIQVGFAVAVLYLVWKIIIYIKQKDSGYIFEDGKDGKDGKWTGENGINDILWGLFGLFIMTSAFVLMQILKNWIGSDIPTP